MAAPKHCVIMHAGTTESWDTNVARQLDIENIMRSIIQKAGSQLAAGAKALDVVQSVVSTLEDCPFFNARKGAVLNEGGKHECEAAIVDGAMGAYGAQALDLYGNLAAAGPTGGMTGKMKGRIGDTVVAGAGLYADKNVAVACSGMGEDILRHSISSKIAALQQSIPLEDAVAQTIINIAKEHPYPCAVIAISAEGHLAIQSSGRVFLTASHTSFGSQASSIGTTIPLLPQHTFFQDTNLSAGLTRYPLTSGHTVIVCHGNIDLMSLSISNFVNVLITVRKRSAAVSSVTKVHRCGLVNDGSGIVSLIPLHGLSKEWQPVLHVVEEYDATFPGYLTSKNGPRMDEGTLDKFQTSISNVTGITAPFDNQFHGEPTDQNIFARIIRGELPQWRICEDDLHVAFLTPFGNTPGYTVLLPRKHLSSDIFSLNDQEYADIVRAAYTVAQHLKAAFDVTRCGILFEGYEIDYAHVKLVPVHDQQLIDGRSFTPMAGPACFHETYLGYLTSQFGPLASNLGELSEEAIKIQELLSLRPVL